MATEFEKAQRFRALHDGQGAFVIPNPWDIGTARLLAHLGFEALATTSAGFAFSQGVQDSAVGRDCMLRHAGDIVKATNLPVSADLENGFGDAPNEVATTIRMAGEVGLVGGSIEDSTGDRDAPLYDFNHAVDRIAAAVAAARDLHFPFTLTARAENYLVGKPDLDDTILRLRAYQAAGADVLYAPGLTREDDIRAVTGALDRPVNVVMGLADCRFGVRDLADMGVKRISVGSALARAALAAFMRASKEMLTDGTFTFADDALPFGEINGMFEG